MNIRIKELRTEHLKKKFGRKITQQEFADRLGLSQNFIWQIEKGEREPSDRTISDICREFGVDRVWMETGAGEPFRPVDRDEQIAAILSRAIAGNTTARDRLIRAFSQLPDEMFEQAEKILEEIVANLQKEKE
jgi:transcriptional regulator with XRE-family HTH domain